MVKIQSSISIAFALALSFAYAAKPATPKEWEACAARAEASVDQRQVRVIGVEAAVKARCGEPPAKEPTGMTGAVGMHPYDLVRSKAWKPKFQSLLKAKYQSFVDRLAVSGKTELVATWAVASGNAPHAGGSDEAAFAINTATGEVFGALLEDGMGLSGFGFGTSWKNAPPYLQQWANERR